MQKVEENCAQRSKLAQWTPAHVASPLLRNQGIATDFRAQEGSQRNASMLLRDTDSRNV